MILIACCIGIGAFAYINHQKEIAHQLQQQQEAERLQKQQEQEVRRAELQTLFDLYLNDFKTDLAAKAKSYKTSRRVLKDLISPYNFETPAFAKENYTMFQTQIAPSLRAQAADIIGIFEAYNQKLNDNLKSEDSELILTFSTQWKKMTKEHLKTYVDFFTREEEMLQAYDALITFYYTHSKRYKVDIENNVFLFKNDNEKAQEIKLKNALKPSR